MKRFYSFFLLSIFLTGCKTEKKTAVPQKQEELSILEKVAMAHGYGNWGRVKELRFTFNVDRDTSHFERTWIWEPKNNAVTAISSSDTLTYNRNTMDSTAHKTNGGFINDKYWLIAPINILWDKENINYEHFENREAPISKESMQQLTVVYGTEGGYTPGDAYDFYFGDDFMVREWVFRKGNQEEPSLATTWEEYSDLNGLKIAKMHQNADGSFKLYFTNVAVENTE